MRKNLVMFLVLFIFFSGMVASYPAAASIGWKVISAGGQNTCGIKSDGTAWCWGQGFSGQLGDGTTNPAQTAPVTVNVKGLSGKAWTAISTGISYACGLRDNGTAWCWGQGSEGQRGDGVTTDVQTTPAAIVEKGVSGRKWTAISAGADSTCGLRDDGTAWCWGFKSGGRFGTDEKISIPQAVDASNVSGEKWVAIKTHSGSMCGLRDDGSGWCWGSGSLGNGDTADAQSPVRISSQNISGLKWSDAVPGGSSGCGLRDNGTLWCWGDNAHGTLGNAQSYSETKPVLVNANAITGAKWVAIDTNDGVACGLRDDGTAWCWGRGFAGQLGNGADKEAQPIPVLVNSKNVSGSKWVNISVSGFHSCGVRNDETAWCWGWGYDGEGGNGSRTQAQTVPVKVAQ